MSHAYALSREPPAGLLVALHDHDAVDRACEADLRALGFDGLTAAARRDLMERHSASTVRAFEAMAGRDEREWIESHDAAVAFDRSDPAGTILGAYGAGAIERMRRVRHRMADDAETADDLRFAAAIVACATRWLRRREGWGRCR